MKKMLSVLTLLCSMATVLQAVTIPTTTVEVVGTGLEPNLVVYSHRGNFAAVTNNDSNSITVYKVNEDEGTFNEISSSPFPAGTGPYGIAFSPSDRYLAVTNMTPDYVAPDVSQSSLFIYKVHSKTGRLTLIQAITRALDPTLAFPTSVAYSPDGRFAAVANYGTSVGTDNTVSIYAVSPLDGKLFLPPVQTYAPSGGGAGPFTVAYSPDGRFASVTLSNSSFDEVANFVVDPVTGEFLNEFDVSTGPDPIGVTYSHNGLFAAVANADSTAVTTYSVNQTTGTFTTLQSAVTTGTDPLYIAYSPDDRVAAVTNISDGTISLFCVDAFGSFSNLQTIPINGGTPAEPLGIDFAPCNNFVAVTDFFNNNVTILQVGVGACS